MNSCSYFSAALWRKRADLQHIKRCEVCRCYSSNAEAVEREKWLAAVHFPFSTSFAPRILPQWPTIASKLISPFSSSLCSFNNSLLPLWSSSWTVQSIAKHNTNKKLILFYFGGPTNTSTWRKFKIKWKVILADKRKRSKEISESINHSPPVSSH